MLLDRSGSRAFAQLIERMRAAGSVQFRTSVKFGHRPAQTGRMYLEDKRMRLEQFDGNLVSIGDFDRGQAVLLDMRGMQFREMDLDRGMRGALRQPHCSIASGQLGRRHVVGQERLEGRLTSVYRLDHVDLLGIKGDAETMVWIDVASELPAQIVIRDTDPKHPTEFRFEDFVWNEPLDADLFSLEIPAGFTPMPPQEGVVILNEPAPRSRRGCAGFCGRRTARIACPHRSCGVLREVRSRRIMRDPESTSPGARRQNQLRQWDTSTGQMRWSHDVQGAGHVAGSPDGTMLATVIGYEVQLRDAATGDVTRTWATEEMLLPLAFSPDGKTLAAGIAEWGPHGGRGGEMWGGVQFWNVEQGNLVRTIVDDKPTTFLRYSPDGELLATSSNDGPVKLWDVATGELVRMFPGRRGDISPDGQTIACISAGSAADKTIGRVDLYNVADGALLKTLVSEAGAEASWLLCAAFSPDGRLLAATDWNGIVSLWNVATGERQQVNVSHKAGVLTAAFSPDGATLATGGEDKTLRLWELPDSADK